MLCLTVRREPWGGRRRSEEEVEEEGNGNGLVEQPATGRSKDEDKTRMNDQELTSFRMKCCSPVDSSRWPEQKTGAAAGQ